MAQTFYGPTPYLQASDSPFFGMSGWQLEDAEDMSYDIPHSTIDFIAWSSAFGTSLIDSVDKDDGEINGVGNAGPLGPGDAFWSSGAITVTFGLNGVPLPTHAGLVWTDGGGLITFEAFGPDDVSLGTTTGEHADGDFFGGTAEDRFYGVSYSGGIKKIRISNPNGGIEVDHIQVAAVPEPTSMVGMAIAGVGMLARRRRRA